MSKRVIYVAFWNEELLDLIHFLQDKGYNQDQIDKLSFMVKEHSLESTGLV